jgi:hypothetical protein
MMRQEDRVEISRTVAEHLTTILREHPGIGTQQLEQLCTAAKLGLATVPGSPQALA